MFKSIESYGNLILNDYETDENGKIEIHTEPPRKDGKVARKFFIVALISLENSRVGCITRVWQTYEKDSLNPSWNIKEISMFYQEQLYGNLNNGLFDRLSNNLPAEINQFLGSDVSGKIYKFEIDDFVVDNDECSIYLADDCKVGDVERIAAEIFTIRKYRKLIIGNS